jgi:hypothetical protein
MLEIMREWLSKTGIFERNRDLATTMKGAVQKRVLAEGPKCIIGNRS